MIFIYQFYSSRKYFSLVLERKFGQHALCVFLFPAIYGFIIFLINPKVYTQQSKFNSHSIGLRQYKDINQLLTNAEMKFTKDRFDGFLPKDHIWGYACRIGVNLYCFKAKTKAYNFHEGHLVKFPV